MSEPLYVETFRIRGGDFEHGGEVATRIKSICKDLGIRPDLIRRLSIANFEAEMNVIMYADQADLTFMVLPEAVRIVVADHGQGIPNIELAMTPGWSTATHEMRARGFGAGLGLPNIRNSADEFQVESTPGVGTTLTYVVRLDSSPGSAGLQRGDVRGNAGPPVEGCTAAPTVPRHSPG